MEKPKNSDFCLSFQTHISKKNKPDLGFISELKLIIPLIF